MTKAPGCLLPSTHADAPSMWLPSARKAFTPHVTETHTVQAFAPHVALLPRPLISNHTSTEGMGFESSWDCTVKSPVGSTQVSPLHDQVGVRYGVGG